MTEFKSLPSFQLWRRSDAAGRISNDLQYDRVSNALMLLQSTNLRLPFLVDELIAHSATPCLLFGEALSQHHLSRLAKGYGATSFQVPCVFICLSCMRGGGCAKVRCTRGRLR